MRTRHRLAWPALLALPLTLSACPSEPTSGVDAPPQPSASASAAPSASASASAPAMPAFENPGGMWMPEQMPLHEATLKSLGVTLDPASLSKLDAAPLGAIVSLGGCTGSFVSADGLIVTNHHCVTGYLAFASKEKNYLAAGLDAKGRAGEVWAGPSARILVTRSMRDVTSEVRAGVDAIKDDVARLREIEKHTKALVAACEKDRPEVRCTVASFFGGSQYRLVEQLEMKDVRLVYVPPEGIGDFGGDVDNWRWPRHGGDFAFLRVYVGKDGKPADHAEANVPYKPAFHLKIASAPLDPGDFVMVAGFPAATYRLKVTSEVEEVATFTYPARIESSSAFISLLETWAAKSEDLKVKTAPQLQGLHNGLIKMRGVVEGLTKGGHLEQRKKNEADLLAWIAANDERKAAWGGAIEAITARVDEAKKHRVHDAAAREILGTPRLLGQAMLVVRLAEERAKPDAERHPDYQERLYKRYADSTTTFQRSFDPGVEKALLTLALERTGKLDARDWPAFATRFLGKTTADERAKKVAQIYDKTRLGDLETRKKLLLTATTADLRKLKDPLIDLALAARPVQKVIQDRDEAFVGALIPLMPRYAAASRQFEKSKGKPDLAPDANGTLRVTFGTVRGYRPKPDAPVYYPFTNLTDLVKKHTDKDPFDAPDAELEAFKAGKKGPYVLDAIHDVPVDFLSDLDITGGNSGSPTLDANGELVGLAFDGNYEGVASDWVFAPETTRTIHVDVRYILWVLDAVSGAKELLTELGRTPTFAK